MELFYIRFKGRVTGPFQREDMQKRAKEGALSRFHEVSTDGQLWKKAADFTDLWGIPSDINSLIAPEEVNDPQPEPAITPIAEEPISLAAVTSDPFPSMPVANTPAPTQQQWHYQQSNGFQCGPLPVSVIHNLIQQGDIVSTTLVWTNGLSDWTQANLVAEFTPLF